MMCRILLLSVALVSVPAIPSAAEETKTVPLFIFAGQSNMVGFDVDAAEFEPQEDDERALLWYRVGDPPPDDHDSFGREWKPIRPQSLAKPMKPRDLATRQYGNFAFPGGGFGPEIGFARAFLEQADETAGSKAVGSESAGSESANGESASNDDSANGDASPANPMTETETSQPATLAILKVAFSGTSLSQDWLPETIDADSSCLKSLIEEYELATAAAEKRGISLKVEGFFWVQGESDATEKDAPKYGQRMQSVLTHLREHLHAPEMPAFLAINTKFKGPSDPQVANVIKEQQRIAIEDPRTMYVDTSECTIANRVHFDTVGTLKAGQLFAAAYQHRHETVLARQQLQNDDIDQLLLDARHGLKLIGSCSLDSLQKSPFDKTFVFEAEANKFPERAIGLCRSKLNAQTKFQVFFGTWCGDSQHYVPKFLQLAKELELSPEQISLHAVDYVSGHYKRSPSGFENGKRIHRVPTIIVYQDDEELGRIVETPCTSLPVDLAQILLGIPSAPKYAVADQLMNRLEESDLIFNSDQEEAFVESFRERVRSVYELSTLVRLYLDQEKVEKARIAARLNATINARHPRVYWDLAKVQMAAKEWAKASESLAKGIRANGESNETAMTLMEQLANR